MINHLNTNVVEGIADIDDKLDDMARRLDAALLPCAEKARTAALAEVDAYGLVRNVCSAPHFDKPGVAPEGQAFHILMEAARKSLHS